MGVFKFACPKCGQHYSTDAARVGMVGNCGSCHVRFRLDKDGPVLLGAPAVPPAAIPRASRVPTRAFVADPAAAPIPEAALAQGDEGRDERPCPICGEPILAVAVRCRHCKSDLGGQSHSGGRQPDHAGTGGGLLKILLIVGGVLFLGVCALAVVLLPALSAARLSAKKRDCTNNLRQLGTYTIMYVTRYGSDRHYPPAAGEGFFNTLRNTPNASQAIARGSDGLFVCKAHGTRPSSTALDYREPGSGLPGRRVSDALTQPQWPIACDRTNNHSVDGTDDINILFFSGSVSAAPSGSPEWNIAIEYTE